MRTQRLMVVTTLVFLCCGSAGPVIAGEPIRDAARLSNGPLQLNMRLGVEPDSLDPAKAWSSASSVVIEQLFTGLVSQDDETAEIQPRLATSWDISPDGAVYTFTLRTDAFWTDGPPGYCF